jgi:hypothetical protein
MSKNSIRNRIMWMQNPGNKSNDDRQENDVVYFANTYTMKFSRVVKIMNYNLSSHTEKSYFLTQVWAGDAAQSVHAWNLGAISKAIKNK